MKITLFALLIAGAMCISHGAAAGGGGNPFNVAKKKCVEIHKVDEAAVDNLMKKRLVPSQENEKCMFGCIMKELNYIKDGKYNLDLIREGNKHRLGRDQSVLEKANEIAKDCVNEIKTEGKNECAMAFEFLTCSTAAAEKIKLFEKKA